MIHVLAIWFAHHATAAKVAHSINVHAHHAAQEVAQTHTTFHAHHPHICQAGHEAVKEGIKEGGERVVKLLADL